MGSKRRKIIFDIAGIDLNSYVYDEDQINDFDCGNKGLNEYLKNDANKDTISGTNTFQIFNNHF